MRPYAVVCALAVSSCAAPVGRNIPIAPGGSVADFDRGTGSFYSPSTGTPAGEPPSIGALDFESPEVLPSPVEIERPVLPRLGSPEEIRRLQKQLSEEGEYHGPINGQQDPALLDALRRRNLASAGGSVFALPPAPDGGATR